MAEPGRIFVLGGPTAAGKSELGLLLAESLDAVLVSADAMTVYRGLDVGTAKPSAQDQARVPHRCIDVRSLQEDFSVADFVQAVEAARAAHPRVLVVGGTPFYLRGLVAPLAALPPADPALRAELEALADPMARLAEVDPPTAARLHPNDRVRIVRALEVAALTGRPMSALHAEGPRCQPGDIAVGWLDRDDLRERIDLRIQAMVAAGYVDETRRALALAGPAAKPLRSFAYRHIVQHLLEGLDLDEALRRSARDTWRFARKQRTWGRSMGWQAASRADLIAAARRALVG